MVDRNAAFEIRIFLVPDPGSFVNMIDKMSVADIASAATGEFVDELKAGGMED